MASASPAPIATDDLNATLEAFIEDIDTRPA